MKKLLVLLFKMLSFGISSLPIRMQLLIGDFIGILWFDVFRIRRRVALGNLRRAFPDWSEPKRIRVARLSVQNLGRSFVEFCRMPLVKESDLKYFTITGIEHLHKALERGNGAFLLTQHIGNGDWATVGLRLRGIELYVISKEMAWEWANDLWFMARKNLGTRFIPDRRSSFAVLKALKSNGVLAYVLDQFMGPPIGVRTKFFGHDTGTAMGLALLAGRSKAAVVPVVTYRRPDGHTMIEFNCEIPYVESSNLDATIANMTQVYCDKVESYVRKFPEQWMWVHRRWKEFRE